MSASSMFNSRGCWPTRPRTGGMTYGGNVLIAADHDEFDSESLRTDESQDQSVSLSLPANAFQRQFVRTPYAVSFLAGTKTFVLVTLHVIYGDNSAGRIGELTAIAKWLRNWAEQEDDYGHNLICLGDFNVDRINDPLYQAFVSTGLTPAPDHAHLPRTVFDKGQPELDSFFDQVAWFQTVKGKPYLTLPYRKGGNFDFRGKVMANLTVQQLSFRLSDHFPLWVEFGR